MRALKAENATYFDQLGQTLTNLLMKERVLMTGGDDVLAKLGQTW